MFGGCSLLLPLHASDNLFVRELPVNLVSNNDSMEFFHSEARSKASRSSAKEIGGKAAATKR